MQIKLKISGKNDYTGFCDVDGNFIFIGDKLQFTTYQNCIWNGLVVFEDGMVTVSILNAEQVKNPDKWDQKHDWIKSRNWSWSVGYGEFGTWNCCRRSLAEIAGYFKDYESYKSAENKCLEKQKGFLHNYLFRPLPVKIVN